MGTGGARVCRWSKVSMGEEEPTKGQQAHFNVLDGTRAVCRFPKNRFGLCDMAGNVWEWCFDRYERLYYERSPKRIQAARMRGCTACCVGGRGRMRRSI